MRLGHHHITVCVRGLERVLPLRQQFPSRLVFSNLQIL